MPETIKCEGASEKGSCGDKAKCDKAKCEKDSKCSKGDANVSGTATPTPEEKKLKPCCACPETKKPRDKCIMDYGEEACGDLIEAHKECMRKLGFKI